MNGVEQPVQTQRVTAQLSDEDFFAPIEQSLARLPALTKMLPPGYPRRHVDKSAALSFEAQRTGRFEHNYNLPLALHLASNENSPPHVRLFAIQCLTELERFAQEFSSTHGARGLLAPLWKAPFDTNDPRFWSVIAEANLAVALKLDGATDIEFEKPTGTGNATADVAYTKDGVKHFADVVLWHGTKGDATSVTKDAARRLSTKAREKFAVLPSGAKAHVVAVCFAQGDTFQSVASEANTVLGQRPVDVPTCTASLLMFVAEGDASGALSGYVITDGQQPLRTHAHPSETPKVH